MANRTVKDAHTVKGTNPQYLIEKIIRTRIYECQYWKEHCFALSAELLVDKAMDLKYIGGVYGGNIKPAPFLCLALKMLQIQPDKDIVVEFIRNEDFKYVRALGAFYLRMTGTSLDCYKYLEPLYNDYRKMKRQNRLGRFEIVHMDEFIDELLHEDRVLDLIIPRIQKRHVLEENNELEPRISPLDDDLEDFEDEDEDTTMEDVIPESRHRRRSKSRTPSPSYRRKYDSPPRHGDRRRASRSPRREDRERRHERRSRSPHDRRERLENERESRRSRREEDRYGSSRHHRSERSTRDEKDRDKKRDSHSNRKAAEAAELNEEIRQANALRAELGMQPLR